MMPWSIKIGSKGNVTGDVLQPVEHAQVNNFQGKDRAVTLRYDGHGGFIDRKVLPDALEDQRDAVPPEQTRDTLDIVSGVLAGLRAVDRTGSCTGKVPVFDGRRRFDLVYSDDGHETMEAQWRRHLCRRCAEMRCEGRAGGRLLAQETRRNSSPAR